MTTGPVVTVCMPAYNYGRYIEQAVLSVFEQDYRPLEFVVVDDGSTDDTQAVLERLSAVAPIPMRILLGDHRGVAAAMNLALAHASGEWIMMAHADDWSRADRARRQVEAADDDTSLVHTAYVSVNEIGIRTAYDSSIDRPPAMGSALQDILLLRSDVRSVSMMFRRDLIIDAGGFDERLPTEDWQAILRLAKRGTIAYVDEPLVFRRVHTTNLSFTGHRRDVPFTKDDFGYSVLREVMPPELDFERVAARHAAVVIRNSLAVGSWQRAFGGIERSWELLPTQRLRLVWLSAGGLVSFAWLRVRPILPTSVVTRLLSLKRLARRLR